MVPSALALPTIAARATDNSAAVIAGIKQLGADVVTLNKTLNTFKANDPLGLFTALKIQQQAGTISKGLTSTSKAANSSSPFTGEESGQIAEATVDLSPQIESLLKNIVRKKPAFATAVFLVGDLSKTVENLLKSQQQLTKGFVAGITPKLADPYRQFAPLITTPIINYFTSAIKAYSKCTGKGGLGVVALQHAALSRSSMIVSSAVARRAEKLANNVAGGKMERSGETPQSCSNWLLTFPERQPVRLDLCRLLRLLCSFRARFHLFECPRRSRAVSHRDHHQVCDPGRGQEPRDPRARGAVHLRRVAGDGVSERGGRGHRTARHVRQQAPPSAHWPAARHLAASQECAYQPARRLPGLRGRGRSCAAAGAQEPAAHQPAGLARGAEDTGLLPAVPAQHRPAAQFELPAVSLELVQCLLAVGKGRVDARKFGTVGLGWDVGHSCLISHFRPWLRNSPVSSAAQQPTPNKVPLYRYASLKLEFAWRLSAPVSNVASNCKLAALRHGREACWHAPMALAQLMLHPPSREVSSPGDRCPKHSRACGLMHLLLAALRVPLVDLSCWCPVVVNMLSTLFGAAPLLSAIAAAQKLPLAPPLTGALGNTTIAGNGSTSPDADGKYHVSSEGIRAYFVPYGASISNLFINDTNGVERDIVLGWDNATHYTTDTLHPHYGSVPGRYANRIKNNTFEIDGVSYHTAANENGGLDTLHGGVNGWDWRNWTVTAHTTDSITFSLVDQDGNQGFPGEVVSYVTYTLTPFSWHIKMLAIATTKKTPIMLSSHTYWNLDGFASPWGDINNHTLHLPYGGQRVGVDGILIPNGTILPNPRGSVNDFWSAPKQLGASLGEPEALGNCGTNCTGYDTCFVFNREAQGPFNWRKDGPVATLASEFSGIQVDVFSDQDAYQIFDCASQNGSVPIKKTQGTPDRRTVPRFGCVVMEVEDWIDGINYPEWGRNKRQIFGPADDPYVLQARPHCRRSHQPFHKTAAMTDQKSSRPSNHALYVDLLAQLGLEPTQHAQIHGAGPICPSPHRINDAAAVALATLGTELAALWQQRTGEHATAQVSVAATTAQLMAIYLTTLNGVTCTRLLEDKALFQLSDFYAARAGRWVFLLSSYPHLRDINCTVLECAFERERIAAAIAQWDAFELEARIGALGGTCIAVRNRAEWTTSAQGALLVDTPVVTITKLAESAPRALPVGGKGLPLQGVRVLDNTHVIAGPMAARIAAEYGAEVLAMASPDHVDPRAMVVETGIGKRSAFCDLEDPGDVARFFEVLAGADVYVNSYLSLEKKGFGPEVLAKHCPGLVYVDYHAWGTEGPWSQRGGFDQLACAATGFSSEEGQSGKPRLPPTYLLNDYLAAIVGAAGMVEALRRRATEGGSWRVHVNLSRICMWVQSMGMFEPHELDGVPPIDSQRVKSERTFSEVQGSFGTTRFLPTQIEFSGSIAAGLSRGAEPTGASTFGWA
ncbi:hypothetical protein FH972_023459 [Carpinus fangiana]|uniref:Uncharacterized protein n=1 Tax=Carpinus fangiana TaxID=176857 RepID=A0A5N6KVM6_9ROSI|nr:hypothetical protein FH972_023459 [Carpinus fangiana]